MINKTSTPNNCDLSLIERYRKNAVHWYQIPRANDASKPLQEKAVNILSTVVHKLRRTDTVILNHNYLSRITKAKKDQNVNLLKQLDDILDISFCVKVTIGNKIHRNAYVIKHTQKGVELLGNPQILYQQNHFIGKKPTPPINITPAEDKQEVRCAEFFPTSSIYKDKVLENRSIKKSNFVKKDFEEKTTKTTQTNILMDNFISKGQYNITI